MQVYVMTSSEDEKQKRVAGSTVRDPLYYGDLASAVADNMQ